MRDAAGWMRWPSASKSSRPSAPADDDLPVEHIATGWEAQLGEVAPQRAAVARLQEDILPIHKREAAEAVELDLVHVRLPLGERLAGECQLRLQRWGEGEGHRIHLSAPVGGLASDDGGRRPRRTVVGRPARGVSSLSWSWFPTPSPSARAREGCTRRGSPRCLRKCGGQGASPRPSRSSRSASSSSESSEPGCCRSRRRGRRVPAAGRERCRGAARRDRRRRPHPTPADRRRARRGPRAPSRRRRRCGRGRSGCSR